jgi:ketosteroid isomerase-like protein
MSDESSIQATISRYAEGASRADWSQVLSTYMPTGVWEISALGARFEGHQAIENGLRQFSAPMDYIVQINAPALLQIHGDTASARSVIRECGKYAGRNEGLEVLGFYADQLRKTVDGWKFTHRMFELRGMHNFPLSPPAAHE